jgi:hypothetical protein
MSGKSACMAGKPWKDVLKIFFNNRGPVAE